MDRKASARCKACRRRLTSQEAIAAGYGPVCYHRLFGKSLSSSLTCPQKEHLKKSKSTNSSHSAAIVNQLSIFDIQEESDGTDTQGQD